MTTKNTPGRRRGAYTQAARVLAILELVRSERGPVPLARIAAQFDLSERQARRDVSMLAEGHGVRTIIVEGRSAVIATEAESVPLSARERMLLVSLGGLAAQLGPGSVGDEVRAVLHRLAPSADEERALPTTLVPAPVTLASAAIGERIDRIEQAIRDRHELRVRLTSDRADVRVVAFLPYVVVLHPSGPHVVGRFDPAEPLRAVPIERLAHVEVAPGTVVVAPHSLDLVRLFEPPRAPASRAAHT